MSEVNKLLGILREKSDKSLSVSGPAAIKGKAYVQGSKNTANKLVALTVAVPGKYRIKNFPKLLDPLELLSIVEKLGGDVSFQEDTVFVNTLDIKNTQLPYELTKTTTGAFGFCGALLGRFGTVNIGKPGGDDIGPRPINLHVDGLRALGAEVTESDIAVQAVLAHPAKNQSFSMRMPSTGAAVTYVLTVVSSHGRATLKNAPSNDSDMDGMYELLQAAGVKIKVSKTSVDVDATELKASKTTINFTCPPDRNDAFTWLSYGALSAEGLLIENIPSKYLGHAFDTLRKLGIHIEERGADTVMVRAPKEKPKMPIDLTIVAGLATEFHSDWAPLVEVIFTKLSGHLRVIDTLFTNRVRQAELLKSMGADIQIGGGPPPAGVKLYFSADPHTARYIVDINGPSQLHPLQDEVGYDVRACAAVLMAASQADGISIISNMRALYRGYENIIERLNRVGVDVTVI